MEKEEAFVGILACAVAADSFFADAELDLLEILLKHHRFTKDMAENVHSEIVERVKKYVVKNGTMTAAVNYTNFIPTEWRGAAFLSALDPMFLFENCNKSVRGFGRKLESCAK